MKLGTLSLLSLANLLYLSATYHKSQSGVLENVESMAEAVCQGGAETW